MNNCIFITRRIGTTIYKVKIFPNKNDIETMEDKLLRLISNQLLSRIWSRNSGKPPSRNVNVSSVMSGNDKFSNKTVKRRKNENLMIAMLRMNK